jgi:hypothetical protein
MRSDGVARNVGAGAVKPRPYDEIRCGVGTISDRARSASLRQLKLLPGDGLELLAVLGGKLEVLGGGVVGG